MNDFAKLVRERKDKEKKDSEEYGKKKLFKIVSKKHLTIGIGAIAAIEKHLGFLFAHNEQRALTKEEQFIKDRVEILRKEILDNTNKQIRNTEEEFKLYTIVCNGYSLNLPVYKEGPK